METHYSVLSIPPTATSEQIRVAYLSKAKEVHPDKVPPEERATANEAFQRLAAAYAVLSDPAKRKAYDSTLPSTLFSSLPPSSSSGFHAPPPPPIRRAPDPSPFGSPFPGYRVPPGGYPRTPAPVFVDEQPLFPSLSSSPLHPREGVTTHLFSPLSCPSSALASSSPYRPTEDDATSLLPDLLDLDPFTLFDRVMALPLTHFRPSGLPLPHPSHHYYPRPPSPHYPHPHPHRPKTITTTTSSAEGRRDPRNGDFEFTESKEVVRKEVERGRQGRVVEFKRVERRVEVETGRPHHYYPHQHRRRRPSYDGGYGGGYDGGYNYGYDDDQRREYAAKLLLERERELERELEREKEHLVHHRPPHHLPHPLPPPLHHSHHPHRPSSPAHPHWPHKPHLPLPCPPSSHYPSHPPHHKPPMICPPSPAPSTLFGGSDYGGGGGRRGGGGALMRRASYGV
ncbi:hypothetical protein JCM11251_003806 [Rhodosporidiobolus azoricus]